MCMKRNVVGVVARKNTFYAEMLLFSTIFPIYPLQFPQHVLEVMVFHFRLVHQLAP